MSTHSVKVRLTQKQIIRTRPGLNSVDFKQRAQNLGRSELKDGEGGKGKIAEGLDHCLGTPRPVEWRRIWDQAKRFAVFESHL